MQYQSVNEFAQSGEKVYTVGPVLKIKIINNTFDKFLSLIYFQNLVFFYSRGSRSLSLSRSPR